MTRRRLHDVNRSFVLALVALASCRNAKRSNVEVETSAKPEPSIDATPPKTTDDVDVKTLGFADTPAEPTKEANEAVHDGLAKHKTGKYAESRALFEKAVAISPDYALAHFDLACAAARLGDFDTTKSELLPLLAMDLPAFAHRFDEDVDLQSFRASQQGLDLHARVGALAAAWKRAAADGVPAVMWREKKGAVDYPAAKEALWLRVGVFSPTTHRFLALAPDVPATAGWYARDDHRAVVIEERIDRCQVDFCPNLRSAHVMLFDDPLAPPTSDAIFVPLAGRMFSSDVAISAGAVRATFSDCELPNCDTGWMRITGKTWSKDTSPLDEPNVRVGIDPWGAILVTMPKGWSLDAKTATLTTASGARIALDKKHRDGATSVLLDGDRALVATSFNECICGAPSGDSARHDFVVSIVDLPAKTARVWRTGDGVTALGIDALGGVSLQVDEKVERWSAIGVVEKETPYVLPPGVLLQAPTGKPDYCCGL